MSASGCRRMLFGQHAETTIPRFCGSILFFIGLSNCSMAQLFPSVGLETGRGMGNMSSAGCWFSAEAFPVHFSRSRSSFSRISARVAATLPGCRPGTLCCNRRSLSAFVARVTAIRSGRCALPSRSICSVMAAMSVVRSFRCNRSSLAAFAARWESICACRCWLRAFSEC